MSEMSKAYFIDMDGVLVRGNRAIPGAVEFIDRLRQSGALYMVLTNNSRFTTRALQVRLRAAGFEVPLELIFTSALATASFLDHQHPGGSAFAIGEAGLTTALHEVGYILTEHSPDYVVLGETIAYTFENITTAINLIDAGARFIATNPDITGPSESGIEPACGAIAAMITAATGANPYFIGKPNPLMIREGLRRCGAHATNAVMIGDRMDTDILAGLESGMETVLVLSGVTKQEDIKRFPYRPDRVVASVASLEI
jgi:NagD protein